ncbi:MAG: VRR-NUC domain-containing protein [Clostridiales bacterium]
MTGSNQGTESQEQIALFRWAAYNIGKYPELEYMYHVPNEGKRNPHTGAKLKMEGLKAGVPDICLPASRSGYHGLYIEMKVGRNKPTKEQERYLNFLQLQGYATAICYGWDKAQELIVQYLEGRL